MKKKMNNNIRIKGKIKRILYLTILPEILVFFVSIYIVITIARSYNIDFMKDTTILFFLIAYVLILYDVFISEIGISRFKIRENNFLMRKRALRYVLNIFKIVLPIYYFFIFYTPYWKLIFLVSIIWISYYGFGGIKNTIIIYFYFRERKLILLEKDFKKRVKFTVPKQMKKFVIENEKIIEYIEEP